MYYDDFAAIPTCVPPLTEQKRIAEILSTWDQTIDHTECLLSNLQLQKQALMQQLLTCQVRLKAFQSKKWSDRVLGELFLERKESGHVNLPLLSITASQGIVHRDELDTKDSSNSDKSSYLRICPGDLGYNTMRMWQGVSATSQHEGIVSPAYTICIPKPGVNVSFMAYLFKFPPMVHRFWRFSQGLVDDTLSLKFASFKKIKVTIPDEKEQQAIAAVLQSADLHIGLTQQKLDALRDQKKGLMQQLLTGKVRVNARAEPPGV